MFFKQYTVGGSLHVLLIKRVHLHIAKEERKKKGEARSYFTIVAARF
jgi:hypothetical protein